MLWTLSFDAIAIEHRRPWWVAVLVALQSSDPGDTSAGVSSIDADDVKATLAGDGDAYARIIRRHQPGLVRRMSRFASAAGDIEELVQETFVEAYFSLNRYRGDAPLEHWLQRIATRVGYRFWKRRDKERMKVVSLDVGDRPAAAEKEWPDVDALMLAVNALPPRDRLVITLVYLEGHSVAEAAKLIGWSKTLVKVQAYRARAKLKKLLEPMEGLL